MATMSLQAAYDQARSYLEANKVEQAIGVAQHILEHFPESLEAHRILGEAYLAGRQFEQAEAAFARVLRADPEDIPAHVGLGITFERQGKLDHAVAEFEQALEVRPDMPELRSQLLRLYTDIWGSEGATLRLSRPGLARLYAKGHMLPQAIQEYRSVIEEQPERFDARVGLAEALWRNQQEQQAAEVCSEILALRPDVLKANLLLGYIKLASGDPDGEPFWRQAQRLDPYQHVARSLFETLPDLPAPNVQIPAWDEARWAERRAREEAERRAREEAERRAAQAAVATAAVAAVEPEPELAPAWGPAKASVTDQGGFDADDLLASLLAMEPPVPTERGVDLDTSSGIVPFSLEDIDGAAPQRATTPAEPELEPFSLADLGLSDEEIAQLRAEPEPLSPPPAVALPATLAEADQVEAVSAPAEPELAPFSLEDLGLSPEEIAQLEAAAGEAAAPPAAPAEPEPAPFSLEDLGLSPEEIAQLEAAAGEAAAPPAEPAEPELTPFSLEELGLSPEEIAQLEAAGEAATPPAEPAEPELAPFSLEDLGLSPEEIAQLEAAQAAAPGEPEPPPFSPNKQELPSRELSVPGATAEAPAAEESDLGEITPFSLDEFDLNAPGFEAGEGELPPSLRPFSIDEPPPATAPSLPEEVEEGAYSWQQPAAKPQPGFARRQEEETPGQGSIFERLKTRAAALPPQEPEPLRPISDEELAQSDYFSHDDVSLRDEESGGQNRFAGGFRLPREDAALIAGAAALTAADRTAEQPTAPPAEPAEPELTPFSLEELGLSPEEIAQLEAAQAAAAPAAEQPPAEPELTPFSLEELGLSPEEIAQLEAAQAAAEQPPAEPELTPFSLEELGLSPEEIAQLEAAQAPAVTPAEPAEPELTPFSLEELGLSPEEIAQLEAAQAPAVTPAEPAEPELTPFSLEELGLSPEEIAQLEAAQAPAVTPAEPAEPELTPFSLEELGLSPEEIAQLEAASRGELPLPATGETIVPGWSRGEEPELTPFALDEQSPEAAASGAELDLSGLKPFSPEDFGAAAQPSAPGEALPEDVEPFSFDDLDLGDLGSFDGQMAGRELGLSAEELEGLDLGQFETILPEHRDARATTPEQGDAALERLMGLGRRQGYVDLTDIIAVVSDPEAEAERIEAIGWALHRAGIQIRDGDEIIDMEEGEAEGDIEAIAPAPEGAEAEVAPFSLEELGLSPEEIAALGLTEATAAAPVAPSAEPELTPFSLEELGLSPEEIAQFEAAQADAAPPAEPAEPELTPFSLEELGLSPEEIAQLEAARAAAEPPAAPPAEPELTPFSLEELGLSPEEIAQLEAARTAAEPPAAPPTEPELTPFSLEELGLSPEEIAQLEAARAAAELPAAGPATEEQADLFDFDLAEAPPVEKVTKRTAPRVEEPPPAVDPADAAFQPEPLDSLDDIWQTPLPPPPAPPATRQEPPQEAPARREPIAGPTAAPPAPVARRDTAPAPRREGGRLITRGRDEERFARREAARLREPASRRGGVPLTMRLSDLTPTGDATLDEYLRQLEGDPENSALALAIGRLCAQTGRADVMVMAYKSLIRAGHDLDLLAEELEGLIDVISDGEVQRHIFRLLGDAYARQGRSRDAIAAYGQAFAR